MKTKKFDFFPLCRIQYWQENSYVLFVCTPAGLFVESVEISEADALKLSTMFGIEVAKSSVYGGGFPVTKREGGK